MHVLPVVLLLAKVQTYYLNRYWIYRGLSKTCRAIVVELDPERGKEVEAEKGELHHIRHVSGEFPKSTFSEESKGHQTWRSSDSFSHKQSFQLLPNDVPLCSSLEGMQAILYYKLDWLLTMHPRTQSYASCSESSSSDIGSTIKLAPFPIRSPIEPPFCKSYTVRGIGETSLNS